MSLPGRERRRSQSAKTPGFETFPRQERNYILMELSSPVKESSRRSSLETNPTPETTESSSPKPRDETKTQVTESTTKIEEQKPKSEDKDEPAPDSNKTEDESKKDEEDEEEEEEEQVDAAVVGEEKSALDAKERSSDSSSDGEWRNKEPSWEELGLVDEEVLGDLHNKVSFLWIVFLLNDVLALGLLKF